jgi:hypothetical protein
MAAIFPRAADFAALARFNGQPDAFSIAYLETLVRSSPRDARDPLLSYAQSLARVGHYREALDWLGHLPRDREVADVELEVLVDYARSLGAGDPLRERLAHRLRDSLVERMADASRARPDERWAKVALEWGWPDLAAQMYRRLSEVDGSRRGQLLREAARWHLASGQPRLAGECYALAAAQAPDEGALERDVLAATAALESAADVVAASRLAESQASRLSHRPDFLRRAIRLATAAGRPGAARDLGRLLVAPHAASDEDLRAQLSRELAVGDAPAALGLAERLVSRHPDRADLRRLEAGLAEQAGDEQLALRDWTRLAL